jgi:transposase
VTASTIFDQVEYLANDLFVILKLLMLMAGNAVQYCIDDTSNRILEVQPVMKPQRNSDKMRLRTGVYTSGLIATMAEGQQIVLFETNIGHAGELIDSILSRRDRLMAKPIIMSDALSHNMPTVIDSENSLCNAHGRREYVDVLSHFPEEVEMILQLYGRFGKMKTQWLIKVFPRPSGWLITGNIHAR